jgi:hypothetical protein
MRTITVNVYKVNELSATAKEKARNWWRERIDFDGTDEKHSIDKFCEHFGVRLSNWNVGPHSPIEYRHDASNENFRGLKLKDFSYDHMPTGYYLDCDLWQTFYLVFKNTGNAKQAFEEALDAGFRGWREDMEYRLTDAAVDEDLEANEYEFDENGRRV